MPWVDTCSKQPIVGPGDEQINAEIQNGTRFVIFEHCFSVIVMTFKRSSDVYFIKANEGTVKHSIGFTLLTLLLGCSGFPWGPIYSLSSRFTNLSGGKNVTQQVLARAHA